MKVYRNPTDMNLLERPAIEKGALDDIIKGVFDKVAELGDTELTELTKKFDGVALDSFKLSQDEWEGADALLTEKLKTAIQVAAKNIKTFHEAQKEPIQKIETAPGVTCWRKSIGIESVGLYIPGGTAPLFSTVLMLAIPAKLAGCEHITLCSPPNKEGKLHPAVIYAGKVAGVTEFYKLGGSQAIAAMTLGTATIPKVNKIFGPGNQYVTAAKQYAQSLGTAIDMPAGPSEVLVVADQSSYPIFVAADLLSQTEHGPDSQCILMSTDEQMVSRVQEEIEKQVEQLSRKDIAKQALENSKAFIFENQDILIQWMNAYAAEHLILAVDDAESYIDKIRNAGSVFLGHYTPESAGDYASGTNHTLPTNGYAKSYSGVSLDSFVKKVTFQKITQGGIQQLGPTIMELAVAEGLDGHGKAVGVRLE